MNHFLLCITASVLILPPPVMLATTDTTSEQTPPGSLPLPGVVCRPEVTALQPQFWNHPSYVRLRPPVRPCRRAASSPALVRSTIRSLSI